MHLFEAVAGGDCALAAELAAPPPALSATEQSQRDLTDKRWTLEHGAARGGEAPGRVPRDNMSPDALAAALGGLTAAPGGGGSSSSSSDSEDEELEDGWERVPVRKGGRRR